MMYSPTQPSEWSHQLMTDKVITPPFTAGTCTASKIQVIKKNDLYNFKHFTSKK